MTDTNVAEADAAETGTQGAAEAAQGASEAQGADQGAEAAGGAQTGAEGASAADATPDWRARLAGDDTKLAGYLARIPSEKALVERVKRYEDDIKAGRYIKPLSADASEEEIAAYRKASGVPDSIDGYLADLPGGLVIGDDDRGETGLDPYLGLMHKFNMPKAQAAELIQAYTQQVEAVRAAEIERIETEDADYAEAGKDALKEEWTGGDYTRNINMVQGFLSTQPEEIRNIIAGGRDAEGRRIGANPAVVRWLASVAGELNPLNTVVPAGGTSQAQAVADEIAKWEGMMGNRQSEYWKGPNADKNQARLRELYDARERAKLK